MGFPLSIEGVALLPNVHAVSPDVLRQVESAIVAQGGSVTDRSASSLSFRVPFLKVSLWFFERGLLTIRSTGRGIVLQYEGSCRRAAISIAILSMFPGLVALRDDVMAGALVALVAWSWVFGLHYFVESRSFSTRFAHVTDTTPATTEVDRSKLRD
jgi:hypothetical protein